MQLWLTHQTDQTYCVCSAPSCSCACLCSPCWSGVLRSAVDWGHRPHQRTRWRTRARETGRMGWRRKRWTCSLTWTNASYRGSGSCRPAPRGPRRSGWNRRARLGAAACPPCLLRREMKSDESADVMSSVDCMWPCWKKTTLEEAERGGEEEEKLEGQREKGMGKREKQRAQMPHYEVLIIKYISPNGVIRKQQIHTHSHANTTTSTRGSPAHSCSLLSSTQGGRSCHGEYKTNSGSAECLFCSKHRLPVLLFGWLTVWLPNQRTQKAGQFAPLSVWGQGCRVLLESNVEQC